MSRGCSGSGTTTAGLRQMSPQELAGNIRDNLKPLLNAAESKRIERATLFLLPAIVSAEGGHLLALIARGWVAHIRSWAEMDRKSCFRCSLQSAQIKMTGIAPRGCLE